MRLNSRVEALEKVADPDIGIAEAIRRAIGEMRAGTYIRAPYIPGKSVMLDAIHKRRLARGDAT